ncbi:MAG TPA: hypothetical protein VGR06_36655 [Actinophytocola sp.]|jgi:hypothetical protein|uniref:hypothetical protein n=1 Tax=Actinophytocola sp. TaxID=1872138 RepID=UPI002DFE98B2|nr:hypothetical protein [Actinophytocola sp.]
MGSLLDFLSVGDGVDVLDDILAVLVPLTLVCSDAGLAYARARLGKRWALASIGEPRPAPASWAVADRCVGVDGYEAAVASACRCAVAYAEAAARLAQAAVPVAAQLAAGRLAVPPEPKTLKPSDIVRMPQRHVPLVQFPVRHAPGGQRAGVAALNADLAAHHRQLGVSIDRLIRVGVPATVFDRRDQRGVGADDVGGAFPAALHAYGGACVWAVTLLHRRAVAPAA